MPLPKRQIEPVHVARSVYNRDDIQPTELETVTNTTLTNIIRQLSSLSKHAEDIFGELARDVGSIADRANSLQARIDRLSIKVTQLDSTVEEVPLTDIQLKKAFKSAKVFDQQIFSRATMPAPMLETYAQCDKPPPLDKLNVYRDDGKDGLKFYTDPNYFFELWRQEMIKDTERVMHDKGKKMHRPRTEGTAGGGAARVNKKRVRPPHNTREKQRQIAIGHGETIMPHNVVYRTPNNEINDEQTTYSNHIRPYNLLSHLETNHNVALVTAVAISGIGVYESRPARPSSIEVRRSYPAESVDGRTEGVYGPLSPPVNQYAHGVANYQATNALQQHQLIQQQQLYDEATYNSQNIYSGQGPMSSESLYAPGTPSRTKPRPSQPPPAPPSSGSGGATPNTSNANTPTRGRSMSTGRDTLPPPPPIPDGMTSPPPPPINNGAVAAKLLARSHSTSRAASPQLGPSTAAHDANALVMAQLNIQINSLNSINTHMQNLNAMNDLPPPPPIPEQLSPKMSPQEHAPPPPPPPPPLEIMNGNGGVASIVQQIIQSQRGSTDKPIANGDIPSNTTIMPNAQAANGVLISAAAQHMIAAKKLLPPFHDSRTDLMKAIRDGITLRKVEKCEQQKEIERATGLHDVASILARRVAIELSESEDSESEDDSEGWMEPNETSA